MKKASYLIAVFLISSLLYFFYSLFFNSQHPATPNHQELSLTPHTVKEQQDLIIAEQHETGSDLTGPLVARMSVQQAEAKVLNLQKIKNPDQNKVTEPHT